MLPSFGSQKFIRARWCSQLIQGTSRFTAAFTINQSRLSIRPHGGAIKPLSIPPLVGLACPYF